MNSFQGHFLLAAPHQLDPNFVEAVILVVEHSNRGAFGLILNGPAKRAAVSRHTTPGGVSAERLRIPSAVPWPDP